MPRSLFRHCFWSVDDLSSDDARLMLAAAAAFKQAGAAARPLRGRHLAVLGEAAHGASADVFAAAAEALGAAVVRIRPSASRLDGDGARDTALTLGRLYGAIECDSDIAPATLGQLARWAGVPVFNAVAGATHPTRLLGDLLTMREHAGKALAGTTLCVAAGAAPLARAWRQLGALTGVGVCSCGAGAGDVHASDFVCEPAAADDAAPALYALEREGGERRSLLAEQAQNHRYVVQAMLSQTVA